MTIIKSVQLAIDPETFQPQLAVEVRLSIELMRDFGSSCELDMKSELGLIFVNELEAKIKEMRDGKLV